MTSHKFDAVIFNFLLIGLFMATKRPKIQYGRHFWAHFCQYKIFKIAKSHLWNVKQGMYMPNNKFLARMVSKFNFSAFLEIVR